MKHWLIALLVFASTAVGVPAQGQVVREHEPNNSATTATLTSLGDTISGEITKGDIDYWAFDVAAGTRLELAGLTRTFCRDFALLDGDGSHLLAFSDCMESNDTLYFPIQTAGRYYVRVTRYNDAPGDTIPRPYAMRFGTYVAPPPGPGNPLALFATGFSRPEGIVAAPTGDLFVVDRGFRIARVTPNGAVSTFATGIQVASGAMAFDGFGDLLVAAYADDEGKSGGVVWRYSPSGQRTRFISQPRPPNLAFTGIAVGSDGDVWFADPGFETPSRIWRFDPVGNLKDTINVAAVGRAWTVAISPQGELHFRTQFGNVYKLTGRTPQLVIRSSQFLVNWSGGLAFDRDGFLYVPQDGGRIALYDRQYQAVSDPFTQVLDSLRWSHARMGAGPVFLRDAHGEMTPRMVTARYCCEQSPGPEDAARGDLLELKSSAARAPGAQVVPDLERVTLGSQRSLTVGEEYQDTLRLADGAQPARWSLIAGRLPTGISLDPSTGALFGAPADTGSFDFSLQASRGGSNGYGRFALSVTAVTVSVAEITEALLDGRALPPATSEFLDQHGNLNGKLDVGDLRAYLRAQHQLPSPLLSKVGP